MYRFTVFTPTYNRAKKLHLVYNSLQKQTFKNFEWLIVDDGSTDNTKDIVLQWKNEADFSIRYIYQKNQGKHIAFNKGVLNANGEFFLTADSDDEFLQNSLEVFNDSWESIENKNEFSAVTALCMDEEGCIVGDKFPKDVFDSNSIEAVYQYNIDGEKWGFHKTSILKKYPFKSFGNEKFIAESTIWNEISKIYKTRYINIPLRIYTQNEDSLSANTITLRINNIYGTLYYYDSIIGLNVRFKSKFKAIINYTRFMCHTNKFFLGFKRSNYKILIFMDLPFGIVFCLLDKFKINTACGSKILNKILKRWMS